ncbi:uncharacterized protein EDB91DRAFT_1244099 [Suillus paluster]|uniref:uncharacterized protein n=1 Tax=Suillus paluster TaxID=48578 RepID=UPI001B85B390|nr:uncharacterized protein EDB91DRAFT_1244099 [Suillus paluster]KAG1750517.1 hypothetical protein EDB91DRAFT_1244099 [Suillus paluster]
MSKRFDVWYHDPREVAQNILANPDYVNKFDYCPFREFSVNKDERRFQDFMSADWAWQQADIIATHPSNLRAMFVPIILGTTKEHAETEEFRNFRCQIFHSSLAKILDMLKDAMSKPKIAHFGNSHYQRVVYGLGPYIVDYEEQVLLMSIMRRWCLRCLAPCQSPNNDALCQCKAHREALFEEDIFSSVLRSDFGIVGEVVPFTNDFPRADIHQLIALDLLHQIIKGCFKDHLVAWVEKYLHHIHGKCEAECIMDDIDQHLAAAVPFTGLRHFPQGHGFKQWTGDDLKVLMKHSMKHYPDLIRLFGAPNGLCSSMTENKHIKAVKQPWRWLNRYNALGKMLVTNQWLDKLAALRIDFTKRGMLNSTCLTDALHTEGSTDNAPDARVNTTVPDVQIESGANLDDGKIDDGPTEVEAQNANVRAPCQHLLSSCLFRTYKNLLGGSYLNSFILATFMTMQPSQPRASQSMMAKSRWSIQRHQDSTHPVTQVRWEECTENTFDPA